MKYLLILLFLFSSYSFTDDLDGKGLTCYKNEESNLKKYSTNLNEALQILLATRDSSRDKEEMTRHMFVRALKLLELDRSDVLTGKRPFSKLGREYAQHAQKKHHNSLRLL